MKTIQELFEDTEIGYSFDRYSPSGWRGCIRLLRRNGYTDRGIYAIMLSKHMRWAADNGYQKYGHHNSKCLERYLAHYNVVLNVEELIAGTNFSTFE